MNLIKNEAVMRPSHLALRRLALCLDCDACFEIGADACPACSSDTWVSLARFLERRYDSYATSGAVADVRRVGDHFVA